MKTLVVLSALLALATRLVAVALPADSKLTAVTVYADRAMVTRIAPLTLPPGNVEVTFEKLPPSLLDQSLQVSGRGAAEVTIVDVTARTTFLNFTPNDRVKALEEELRALTKQRRALDDRARLLEAHGKTIEHVEAALIAPPSKETPRPALIDLSASISFVTEQRAKIATDTAALDEERTALAEKITALERQLAALHGSGGKNYKTVTVRLDVKSAGQLDLTLSYSVPGASWIPSYDARVASSERIVELGYFGVVRQNTGEDWPDVALTLSTARPSLGGAAPEIRPWSLDVFVPRPAPASPEAAVMLQPFEVSMAKEKSLSFGGGAGRLNTSIVDQASSIAVATVETAVTSASFKIAAGTTVPSDNSPQKVPITTARLATTPEFSTVPKRLAAAFLTANVTNSSEFPLLAGAMNVFLDGTFVATSSIRTVMPGEKFDLALGADEGVAVKHKRVSRFTEDTGLTNRGKRVTYDYLLTLQNNKRTAERIIVTDQVPLSRNEKIVVKVLAPDSRELKPTADGTLKWTLDLKPGEKRDLSVKFSVDYPADTNVTGLE